MSEPSGLDRYLVGFRRGGIRSARGVLLVAWVVAVLAVFVVVALVVAFVVSSATDRWTVAGGVAGISALLFAFIATLVAVIAYRDSTLKSVLRIAVLGCSDAQPIDGTGMFRWIASMTLVNDGPVAARFIAVRVTLEGAEFDDRLPGWPIDPDKRIVQWDGGTNSIIHPHWKQNVRALDMWVVPSEKSAGTFTAKFEVVADRTGTLTQKHTVKLERA